MDRRTERLSHQLAIKYNTDYSLIVDLLELIGKESTIKTLNMKPKDLSKTARVNFTKVNRKEAITRLAWENIIAKPIPELPEGIEIIQGTKKVGSSFSYLSGEIMPQGLGSMLTVDALDPKPGEFIIDIAAAPGGKSCFIAERMDGQGTLLVNDISQSRYRSLIFNLTRHGHQNIQFTNKDGRKIERNNVDRILLDAPCTGGGLIVSKPERRNSRDVTDSMQLQRVQVQLLKHALSLLKPNGVCLYATCAISPIENESVVEKFRNQVSFHSLSISGVDSVLNNTVIGKRLYPHLHACDGFFIVRMEKL